MRKIYLILGASSDLGIELIKELNYENPADEKVFIAHYHSSKERLEQISLNQNSSLVCIQADLGDMVSVDLFIKQICAYCANYNMDAPTHVVHLAAEPLRYMKLKEFCRDELVHSIDVQVCSFAKIMQFFLPKMAKRKQYDKIVIMLTSYLNIPPRYVLDYITTKSALLGLMRGLSADYTGKEVNINALSPSMIETKFLKNLDERIVQMVADSSPEKRNATPKDIVPIIQFLLSEKSNYLHGVNLNVSCGGII